jgi:dTDP-4-amino-4,6-dideoxygalactose transaminase
MQFIDLQAQYLHSKELIDKRINNVLSHGKYIMGPEVSELEEHLADYVGVKHAITCANGTDALTLCMMTLGIKSGDAVFCPTFTFFATAEVIAFAGAIPIFVDSDESTFNICSKSLEEKIKAVIKEGKYEPKAIIAVDLFGLPANYPVIEKLAQKYNLKLIEDAAQGFGGSINGRKSCSFGDIATTSFFPAKPLGCYGDGGAVFTDNDEYAELLKSFRVHGKGIDKYDNVRIGMNSRLDTIQAAILIEKLVIFPQEMSRKNEIANLYNNKLSANFIVPTVPANYESSWAQYTIRDQHRDDLIEKLKISNIPAMVYYATNMHQQSAFNRSNSNIINLKIAEKLSSTVLSLPMHAYLSDKDVLFISESL